MFPKTWMFYVIPLIKVNKAPFLQFVMWTLNFSVLSSFLILEKKLTSQKLSPPLIQMKFIGVLKDSIPIEFESYEIPIECLKTYKFGRKSSMRFYLMETFLWVFISPLIPVFFLRSNQTAIPVFCNPLFYTCTCIKILRFSYSYVFSILWFKGAIVCFCYRWSTV